MSLTKRLVEVEKAFAKQNGEHGYRLVFCKDGESESEAKARAGLADWTGLIVFLDELDATA